MLLGTATLQVRDLNSVALLPYLMRLCGLSGSDDESDDEDFPMDEDSDDLLDLDDMPNIPLTSAFADSDEEDEVDLGGKRKRGTDEKKERKKKRKFPTLASAEDYAALINDGADEDL